MRILAIRGTNLASLPEFNIDFTADPLNRSGLFAITGKTGAGKSTILDALCLALFDKTPRLAGGGAMVGRVGENADSRVNSGDVRSIVRQGTASSSAEVDFVGRDGRSYRATWQVRRARSRTDGKFQPQTVGLLDLETSQPLGGLKMETLALIQEKIGLTYEQFRRSVLLAQGEFAAFLRADSRERAELLEKITGTDIYARLSVAAFARKRSEEHALEQLTQQLGSIIFMSEEERAAALVTMEELDKSLVQSNKQRAQLELNEAWYSRHDQLNENIATAQLALGTAREANNALQPVRERLKLIEDVERFRPLVATVNQTGEHLKTAIARRDELLVAATTAQTALELKRAAVNESAKSVETATKQLEEAKPSIGKARELDLRLIDATQHFNLRKEELSAAQKESDEAKILLEAINVELNTANQEIYTADAWVKEHEWVLPVVTQWERWKIEIERYVSSHRRIIEITRLTSDGTTAADEADAALQNAHKALIPAEEAFKQASASNDEAEKAANGVDLEEVRKRIDAEQVKLTAVGELNRIAGEVQQAISGREAAESHIKAVSAAVKECDDSLADDKGSLPAAIAARDEAEHSLALARASMDLTEHRSTLIDGDPCPLCGSHDHPYRAGNLPSEKLTSSLETRFNELRDAISNRESRIAATIVRREALENDLLREQQTRAVCLEKLVTLCATWIEHSAVFPAGSLPADPANNDAATSILGLQSSISQSLETLRREESAGNILLSAVAPARATLEKTRKEREKALEALTKADQKAREAILMLENLTRDLVKEESTFAALSVLLEVPFAAWTDWQKQIAADSESFISEVERMYTLWTDWTGRRSASVIVRDDAISRVKEASARCELIARSVTVKQTATTEQEQQVTTLLADRQKLLNGLSADEVEQGLSSRLSNAGEQLRSANEATALAEKQASSAQGKLEEAEKQSVSASAGHEQAKAAYEKELSAAEKSDENIRELLSVSDEWRKETSEKLKKAEAGLQDATTRLSERQDLLAQHLKTDVPSIAREAMATLKEEEAIRGRELEEKSFSLRHSLTVEAENRKKAESLLPQIEAQRRITNLWLGISDLIGSADGKKFRVFAQSLTLDLLLDMANEHLLSLSPRFSLMRIPSSEMDLQVIDRDMGDDIRSVNCISGGESFLISLALALGLSSLASGTTRIGSLFIDEGFGSLDQDTLDTALSTLDALQASGRMVGIISHVSGLTERIGTRIEVTATGNGKSVVTVRGV